MKAVVAVFINKQIKDPPLWGGKTGQEGMEECSGQQQL